jgi:hypothetical protein
MVGFRRVLQTEQEADTQGRVYQVTHKLILSCLSLHNIVQVGRQVSRQDREASGKAGPGAPVFFVRPRRSARKQVAVGKELRLTLFPE